MGGHFVDGCVRVQVATPVQVVAEESGSRIDTMLMKVAKRLCVAHRLPKGVVPGCVLHQGSFVRLLPAYPVSTQQPSLRHPASRAALPMGGQLEGPPNSI
jgi:hypothetical protein